MSRERPPRTDIPRNLSFIAALTERAYYRSQRPSLEEEPEEEPGQGGTRLGARSRAHAPSRGRRARSAPAGGGGARAPRSRSPDTRKRVRFADALGLELTAVRRFRPGELPRVPRHVQVQLQRDALRHFAPCQSRARGLQVSGRATPLPRDLPCPAAAAGWEGTYQGTPISVSYPGLALALPFWGSPLASDSRPRPQPGGTLTAGRRGRPRIGPLRRPDPAPCLFPLSTRPSFPSPSPRRRRAPPWSRPASPASPPACRRSASAWNAPRRARWAWPGARACWTWPTRSA